MIEHVKTVRTVSLQLWVSQPVGRLGTSAHAPIVGAYRMPLETWADMSHLAPVEGWRAGEGVQGILYACGQLGHGDDPVAARDPRVDDLAALERTALDFLEKDLGHIWPAGREAAGGVRWDALFDPEGRAGAERLRAQYLRVNASPSDRYVLSVPGSQKHRIAPDDTGFEGLVVAGDWTRTGYDLGCIEAATMSGLQAARALGAPVEVLGEVRRRRAYQAIVEAKARVTALRGFGPLPGTLRVDWDDHDSHPFSAELGLAPGGQEALAAAWVDFDFVMESGREVFNAARDGGSSARLTAS
ncbi:FAD-dependent oxidoreductase [Sorangium sp. So ce590]|uniref:FAD-dependent oxidoreductase n=1 Tax=Sorangium sp. So ce590 TaxID=3133317 RepID=UPI003F63B537